MLINLMPSLIAFREHVNKFFNNPENPEKFTYERLEEVTNEKALESIKPILALNNLKPDFISLGALARNIFYKILREHITQDY